MFAPNIPHMCIALIKKRYLSFFYYHFYPSYVSLYTETISFCAERAMHADAL